MCHKLKITIKRKTDVVTFQVQAADGNGTGVACFSINALGKFILEWNWSGLFFKQCFGKVCFQLLPACNWT